jgi:hypothetical protein
MDEKAIAGKTSGRRSPRSRAALAALRAALRHGHVDDHRLEVLEANRDLTAVEAARRVAWPLERARLRRELERMSQPAAGSRTPAATGLLEP